MDRSTPASGGATAPVPDDQAPEPAGPQQLELRLFERIDAFHGVPPDRALWRELLDLAIGTVKTFRAQGQSLSAAAVHHMGWAVYGRTNRAGIAEVTNNKLAEDTRRKRPVVTALVTVLNRLRVIQTTRSSRRAPSFHRLNLGGMAWPAIRRRARMMHDEQAKLDLQAEDQLSLPGSFPRAASGQHYGPLSCQQSGQLKGYVQGQISVPIAPAAGTSRASSADQEQQPASPTGAENLIRAIAGRSREHDVPFAETAVRRRVAAGELTTDDLFSYLNDALPPRMNTQDPEAHARFDADEAAGRVDRRRKGGYPAPPDDPRFTTEDETGGNLARALTSIKRRQARGARLGGDNGHGDPGMGSP